MLSGSLSGDGSSAAYKTQRGKVVFAADGSFGGGSMNAEVTTDGGTTWITVGAVTSDGSVQVDFPYPVEVRFTMAGSTTPSVNYVII